MFAVTVILIAGVHSNTKTVAIPATDAPTKPAAPIDKLKEEVYSFNKATNPSTPNTTKVTSATPTAIPATSKSASKTPTTADKATPAATTPKTVTAAPTATAGPAAEAKTDN